MRAYWPRQLAANDFQDRSDEMKKYFKKICRDNDDEGAWYKLWAKMILEFIKSEESLKHRKALNAIFGDNKSGDDSGWL